MLDVDSIVARSGFKNVPGSDTPSSRQTLVTLAGVMVPKREIESVERKLDVIIVPSLVGTCGGPSCNAACGGAGTVTALPPA